jgi:hypothetical protein
MLLAHCKEGTIDSWTLDEDVVLLDHWLHASRSCIPTILNNLVVSGRSWSAINQRFSFWRNKLPVSVTKQLADGGAETALGRAS